MREAPATVYKLTHIETERFYVGVTTKPLGLRFSAHMSGMRLGNHQNRRLRAAWTGLKRHWKIEPLVTVPFEFRFEAELVYIELLRPELNERVPWRPGAPKLNMNRYLKFF